jgi:hypothetical protein
VAALAATAVTDMVELNLLAPDCLCPFHDTEGNLLKVSRVR